MRKESIVQNVVIVVLAIAVITMSVGYAALSQQLKVTGEATFKQAKWDVHFDENSFNETSTIHATDFAVGEHD